MESSQLAARTQPRTAHRAPRTGISRSDSPTIQSAGGALGSAPAQAEPTRMALSLAPGPERGRQRTSEASSRREATAGAAALSQNNPRTCLLLSLILMTMLLIFR